MAATLKQALDKAARDGQRWLLQRLIRTSPVDTGLYKRSWRRLAPYGVSNDASRNGREYAIYASRHNNQHLKRALDAYPIYLAERLRIRLGRKRRFRNKQALGAYLRRF